MLTKLTVRNFKRFREVEVELGDPVVLIGPNNSGKTTALQALALWEAGLRRWNEKRKGMEVPEKRPGVAINRRDLVSLPVPAANLLWHGLHVRDVRRVNGKQSTRNVRIDVIVDGVTADQVWTCGLEFDYANEESFYCRPLRLSDERNPERMPVPDRAGNVRVAFLPPMSGLAANETRLDPGAINVRVGAMRQSVEEVVEALERLDKGSPWGGELKVSDEFLVPVFRSFFRKLGLPNIMSKKDFHELAELVPEDKLEAEVRAKLDAIADTAGAAQPVVDEG